jgi:hypothetical protein
MGGKGEKGKRAARWQPTPFKAAVAGEKNGVRGSGMRRGRVLGGGAGGLARQLVGPSAESGGNRWARQSWRMSRGGGKGDPRRMGRDRRTGGIDLIQIKDGLPEI